MWMEVCRVGRRLACDPPSCLRSEKKRNAAPKRSLGLRAPGWLGGRDSTARDGARARATGPPRRRPPPPPTRQSISQCLLASRSAPQGCAGSTPANDSSIGGPPGKQQQGANAEKDAAAAEIQRAASGFLRAKTSDDLRKEQDAAAAEIQRAASGFLLDKRASESAPAPAGDFFAGLFSMFSAPAAAPPAAAPDRV